MSTSVFLHPEGFIVTYRRWEVIKLMTKWFCVLYVGVKLLGGGPDVWWGHKARVTVDFFNFLLLNFLIFHPDKLN